MQERKILIVDDQMGIRMLLSEVLKSEGYTIIEASNGVVALELASREQPDLILLDMKLPGMDGLQILKSLRANGVSVSVIMMTAYGELELINEAIALGAKSHFTKPFDIDDLIVLVNQHFGLQTGENEGVATVI
ncbi:MAG: response regulator receiver protein [Bacillota bacterium]|jgi:two-component system response regulator (stage 0 sporulation protein F)